MKVFLWSMLFFFNYCFAAPLITKFVQDVHYKEINTIASQSVTELHYFFSFTCHACAKISKIIHPFLGKLHPEYRVFSYPMVMNQGTFQLARAYTIMRADPKQHSLIQALFELGHYRGLTDEKIITFLEKKGDKNFRSRWESISAEYVNQLSRDAAQRAQNYKLNVIPVCYVLGPKGAFMVHPSKELPPESIPDCLEYLLAYQIR